MKTFFIVVLANFIGLSYQADWSYNYETQWPGHCTAGQQQSPINIMTRDALVDLHGVHIRGPLIMRGYNEVKMTALNNGHTLKWEVDDDWPPPNLSGGPLRGNYTLLQFHLHWLSEHALDGMKYPLEIHFVHRKYGLTTQEALAQRDGLAVVGVLFEIDTGAKADFTLEELMPAVPYITDRDTNKDRPTNIDLTRLISPNPQSFYTYHGSLTTPDCNEVVTWIVMDKTTTISDTDYKTLNTADVGVSQNYRSLQPTNRVVYRSAPSCATLVTPGSLGALLTLLHCLATNLGHLWNKGSCAVQNLKKKFLGVDVGLCALVKP